MPRHHAFETAAARRRRDPIIWKIDDTEVRLVSTAHLADLADLIDTLQTDPGEGMSPMQAAVARRDALMAIVRRFILPDSHDDWDGLKIDIDVRTLNDMVSELIAEFSGAGNPTKPSSSSVGSDATGESSTDGAAAEDSTPSTSQPTER